MGIKLSNQRIFEVLKRDKIFFDMYLNHYFNRLLNSEYKTIKDIFITFYRDECRDLLSLSDKLNYPEKGYRNKEIDSSINHISVNKAKNMLYLYLGNYNSIWKNVSVLERESLLYISLTRVYPFIDNNEMIIHMSLISNLINNNYPPVMLRNINSDIINNKDALKLKSIISEEIEQEMLVMIDLYKKHYLFPENISIDEIIIKKTKY